MQTAADASESDDAAAEASPVDAELPAPLALFTDAPLSPGLQDDIAAAGWEKPTPIQARAIPVVFAGHDLIGAAQTGTGKTGAFAIPILERFPRSLPPVEKGKGNRFAPAQPVVLILTPTRELANQILGVFDMLSKSDPAGVALLMGGQGYGKQKDQLRDGASIVVATPGRLLDHMEHGVLNLDAVQMLVLDEADRMFDMGFAPQIRKILKATPKPRQTMLFSATMPSALTRLAREHLVDPVRVEIAPPSSTAEGVQQEIVTILSGTKVDKLEEVLAGIEGQVLIFSRTKRGADLISRMLNRHEDWTVEALHADRSQRERDRALQNFREGKVRILVATDVASRGLDIEGIACVINFDFPENPEDYIHRVGRTARAERTGRAISLVDATELPLLEAVEGRLGKRLPRAGQPTYKANHPGTGSLNLGKMRRRRR